MSSFKIGVLADIQYEDADDHKKCQYRQSLSKLDSAVKTLNSHELDFVVQLGDLVNKNLSSFSPVLERLEKLTAPTFHVLGNHDFIVEDLEKPTIPFVLNMPSRYYSFDQEGWRFIFLDGSDLSLNAYPENSHMYKISQKALDQVTSKSEWWNGALSETQMKWLAASLSDAELKQKKVAIFCHFPITPDSRFTLWNSDKVLELIQSYSSVKCWFSGHHHEGSYSFLEKKHFLTFKGMVESELPTFSTLEFKENEVVVTGYGNESDRVLTF
ncbi:MAG: metallophosphoesterase [Lentisphaeraceae bacterium]|nr:metallophosphoesterase [Lentisphaeraceae bacterium]